MAVQRKQSRKNIGRSGMTVSKKSLIGGLFSVIKHKNTNSKRRESVGKIAKEYVSLSEFLEVYEIRNRKSLGRGYRFRDFYFRKFHLIARLPWKKSLTFLGGATIRLFAVFLIAAIVYGVTPGALSAPKSVSVTTRADWEKGTLTQVSSTSATDSIQLQSSGSWGARVWAPTKEPINAGNASVSVGNYVYVTRGQSDKAFWRYDITTNTWDALSDLPQPAYVGADMTYIASSGDIYMQFGGYSLKFYKYNIASGAWTRLTDLLDAPYSGASLENDGTDVYFARGNASTDFYKYSVATGEWLNRAPITASLSTGGDIVNGQDGYIYAIRGTAATAVYRYNLSTNVWTTRTAVMPAAVAGDQRVVYANGYVYVMRGGSTTTFYRYTVATDTWLSMVGTNEFAPMTTSYPSMAYNASENKIYAFRGLNTTDMWKFDPTLGTNGQWVGPKQVMDGSITLNTGSDLMWNGQTGASAYVYAVRGGNTNTFYRYDVATNSWSSKRVLPYTLNTDTKGTWCNGYAYYLQPASVSFHQYAEDTWTTYSTSPNSLPATAGAGSGLACASDNSIYAIRGGGSSTFYRWVSGTGWSTLPAMTIGTVTYNANVGSRIAAIGTDIYVMPGNGETALLKYSAGAWSAVKTTPFSQYLGTDMTVYNGKIYALAGYYKNELWEYTPTSDAWRLLPADQTYTFARGPYSGASIEYAGGTSLYATPGNGLADMWSYTVPSTNYLSSGTYVSQAIDLSYVNTWVNFTATDTKPANTSITYETRTSNDQSTWSSWQALSGTAIQSPKARYVQVRATLAGDGTNTPTVDGFSIDYTSEDVHPTNPTGVNAYSQNGAGQTLSSGSTYSYDHPYFQWAGAADSGSGVAGYYVYFGPNVSADPQTDGVFQTALTYTSSTAFTETDTFQPKPYYLRIRTRDNDGNVSDAIWDAFTYVYGGASPVLSQTISSQTEFNAGSFSNTTSLSDGSVRLSGISGLWNQSRLSLAFGNLYYGAKFALGACAGNSNHCLYTAAGNGNAFYRYEIETDTWTSKAVVPTALATVYYGGTLVEGPPGYLYLAKGNLQSTFLQYEIETNTWSAVDSAPKNFDYGGNLSYDGSRYIYGMPGNDDAFYRYDTCYGQTGCTRGWTTLSNADFGNPNTVDGQKVYEGSDSVYDGRNNVYVLQGNLLPYFAKYSVANDADHGETHNTWTPLTPAPEGMYDGGTIAFDQATQSIFAIGGNNVTTGNLKQNFYRYDIDTNTWSTLPDAPALVSAGASMITYNGYVYLERGGNTTGFYRYNIADNTWELPRSGFFGPSVPTGNGTGVNSFVPYAAGTSLSSDDGTNLYVVRGGLDNTFGKYDTATGSWNDLARLPVGATTGASITYNKTEKSVYYIPGSLSTTRTGYTTYFFKYDVATNTWSEITSDRPAGQVTTGSSMTYDGTQYIYLTQGGSYVWWRYDTQGTAGSRWSTMTAMTPAACIGTIGDGSKIVYKNGYVYVTRGGGTTSTCRFTISGSTWTALGVLPNTASTGSSLTDPGDGYLYTARGNATNDYYRYDTSQATPGTWQTVSSTPDLKVPALVTTGGVGAYANHKNWIISGAGTNSYADGLYSYLVGSSSGGTGFVKTGTYTGPTMDLLSVYHFSNLVVNYTAPANTYIGFETRTSSDGSTWSDWAATQNDSASGTTHTMTIHSAPARYVQVRVSVSSADQVFSPTVNDITVNYYQDIDAPSNPTAVSAYSDVTHTTGIISDTWNGYATPSFSWPAAGQTGGANDTPGGSGVSGYYVYFGEQSDADAFMLGTFQTGTTYTVSNLVSGKTYYLKIKAVDYASMFPPSDFEAFTYKYDVDSPTNPASFSVTPTGYSSVDNYSFLWSADAADNYAGVAKFQYRTDGDAAGVWYDITDPSTVSITIPNADHIVGAYQTGKNKFYLRTVDNAGNVSSPTAQEYYYNVSAPTPPQNLQATPTSSSTNSFSFTWDIPASYVGDVTKLKYYYAVNTLPTEYNVVETPLTFAGPGPFATQKGSNTFYVVAMDEAGNVDYNLYASVSFSADTSSPPVPVNVQSFDTSDRETAEYSVAVKWSVPEGIDTGNFAGYAIFRSEDGIDYSEIATTSGSAYVDTGLESQLYYYYVKSKDKTNNYSIGSTVVSLTPTGRYTHPPLLVGVPKYAVQSFESTFTWATNRAASSFVEYGETISLGKTNGQVDSVTDHSVELTGLKADTKYFYRVKFIDPDGNIGTSDISNFTTLPPPTVSEFAVTDIALDSAYVSWKTNTSATCTLKYGAGSLSGSIEESSGSTSHVQRIEGLSAETDYVTQVECVDSDLNTFSSDQYKFSTPVKPVATDIRVENQDNVDIPTVIVEYATNVPTTTLVSFRYEGESPHTYLTTDMATEHRAELQGLEPAKEYTLSIGGTDGNGIALEAGDQKITTKTDSRPPEIVTNRAVGKTIGRGKNSQANIYVKIETNEPTTVRINYAKGVAASNLEQSTNEDPSNTYHLITIPAEIGQVYSYQAKVTDVAGNVTTSAVVSVVVEQAKETAAEVISGTISSRFGWIGTLFQTN
ncbi:MAG TPA: fibronectin type III domain-containing protein [Candidatus Fimivivens sp.]|nr:fibronectin type III domain-containing protein [Candidatus Fimivivens sp.]